MNVSASGAQGAQENLKSNKPTSVEERVKNAGKDQTPPPKAEESKDVENPNNGVDLSA